MLPPAARQLLRPLILCGPSGAGKGTLVHKFLFKDPVFGPLFGFSVSHTTRKPRHGEVDGVDYHFVDSEARMRELMASTPQPQHLQATTTTTSPPPMGATPFFVETAEVHGNLYGTSFDAVRHVQEQGLICLLDVDIQGVRTIKESGLLAAHSFFMTPPLAQLEARLRGRGTETEESLRLRLANAEREISEATGARGKDLFDEVLIADSTAEIFDLLQPKLHAWYPDAGEV